MSIRADWWKKREAEGDVEVYDLADLKLRTGETLAGKLDELELRARREGKRIMAVDPGVYVIWASPQVTK